MSLLGVVKASSRSRSGLGSVGFGRRTMARSARVGAQLETRCSSSYRRHCRRLQAAPCRSPFRGAPRGQRGGSGCGGRASRAPGPGMKSRVPGAVEGGGVKPNPPGRSLWTTRGRFRACSAALDQRARIRTEHSGIGRESGQTSAIDGGVCASIHLGPSFPRFNLPNHRVTCCRSRGVMIILGRLLAAHSILVAWESLRVNRSICFSRSISD